MPRSNFQEFTDDNAAPTSPDHCETEALGCLGALPPLSKRSRWSNGRNGARNRRSVLDPIVVIHVDLGCH